MFLAVGRVGRSEDVGSDFGWMTEIEGSGEGWAEDDGGAEPALSSDVSWRVVCVESSDSGVRGRSSVGSWGLFDDEVDIHSC